MFLGMTYYQIFSYFVIYSFFGWCVEVVYHAIRFGRVVNRGFLNGPVCPVYGFGVILVFGALNTLSQAFSSTGGMQSIPIPILYVVGMILTTFTEFVGGYLLDKFFHARWWDYRKEKFNLNGYICLKFSLIWGVGIVLVIKLLHPIMIGGQVQRIPEKYGWWILLVFYAAYISDVIVSALTMMKLNQQLAELEELRQSMRVVSNRISYVLAEGTFVTENLVKKGERNYETPTAADAMNTLETREEFDVKYGELQSSMQEKRDAIESSMQEKREAAAAAADAATERAAAARDAVAEQTATAAEAMKKRVSEATNALSDKVSAVAEAARENVADLQLKSLEEKDRRVAEAQTRMEQAEKEFSEWVEKFNAKRHGLMRYLVRSHPDIQHMEYQEAMDELRKIMEDNKKAG